MRRSSSILTAVLLLVVTLGGAACDGSSPFAPESPSGGDDSFPSRSDNVSGTIASASLVDGNPAESTIRLSSQLEIHLTSMTIVDPTGDITDLGALRSALQAGAAVRVEVEGRIQGGVITATRLRFETGASGGSGNDDGSLGQDEIHGAVVAVDPGTRVVTLESGARLRIATDALIAADGDFRTLEAIADALNRGVAVRVEADVRLVADGVFEVTTSKFETDDEAVDDDEDDDDDADDEDDEDDADELHGFVLAVDLGTRTVTLEDGTRMRIATDALIDGDGDFSTLEGLADAIAAGVDVRVEADVRPGADGVFEVTSSKFETDDEAFDDDEDDDADDDEDDDADEVEGLVGSVDLVARTITTTDGIVVRIASDALIDDSGDVLSLADVELLVAAGVEVEIEADGVSTADAFVASKAKFEVD